GVGRLVEGGRGTHLILRPRPQRHLDRPPPLCGLQLPDQSLLPPSDRAIRKPRRTAKPETPREVNWVHTDIRARNHTGVDHSTPSAQPTPAIGSPAAGR